MQAEATSNGSAIRICLSIAQVTVQSACHGLMVRNVVTYKLVLATHRTGMSRSWHISEFERAVETSDLLHAGVAGNARQLGAQRLVRGGTALNHTDRVVELGRVSDAVEFSGER